MGIRGLSQYAHEHLDVWERHKLRNCNVIFDGNNLAHYLHKECTGINIAFGGDFDKYASFVQKYFEGLHSCGVNTLVVMDGGQPTEHKKFKTAQERAENHIVRCLNIELENQFIEKIFPPICLQTFVTTLHNMGVLVLQTDHEADDDIGALARIMNCIVISDDSDFYITDVAYVRLSSVDYKNISKKKYIPCCHFNRETFCETTGVNRSHLPLLGTLLVNDYVQKEDLASFHKRVAMEMKCYRRSAGLGRPLTIKVVMQWMARRKNKTIPQLINEAAGRNVPLKKKILQSISGYIKDTSELLECIPYTMHAKGGEDVENKAEKKEYALAIGNVKAHQLPPQMQTTLTLKNGEELPHWFVKAYREIRIPHEVADILTQGYFFSPAQVESISSGSSYLVVEPIVRVVYTFLWSSCKSRDKDDDLSEKCGSLSLNNDVSEDGSSDVCLQTKLTENENDKHDESSSLEVATSELTEKKSRKKNVEQVLLWYIRKKKSLWCKHLNFLKGKVADQLPSINDIWGMSVIERKLAFYKMLQVKCVCNGDIPGDVELIMNCITYWFRNSKEQLTECHALTVLVAFFLFHIIDRKIGKVRTLKGFENVESCSSKLPVLLEDPVYCKTDASAKDLLDHMSHEECLVAGSVLFKYHHLGKTMNRFRYKKNVVHSFSEYQACVYFLQLLNSLLCSPFPFLSIEFLWGGTFGYNVFIDFNGSDDRIAKVSEILGKGTCLERLFCMTFNMLDKALKFKKPPVDKKDSKNSAAFIKGSKSLNDKSKDDAEGGSPVPVKKKKVKDKVDDLNHLGDNRFAELVSDTGSESDDQ